MSFKKLLRKSAQIQVQHPYLVLFIILIITGFMIYGSTKVRTVASLEQMMPKGVEEIQAFNTLRDNALGQDMIAIVVHTDTQHAFNGAIIDVTDQRAIAYIQDLKTHITTHTDILEAYAASDIILMAAQQSGLAVSHVRDLTPQEYAAIIAQPRVRAQLTQFINTDKSITIIIASTDVSADDERMKLLSRQIVNDITHSGAPAGLATKITGTPIIQQQLGVLIAKDRTVTQNISTLFVFIIVALVFASITSAIVPILIVTISVYWLYGIMGYTNLPISTLAGGVAAMVIGIGIDYAIMMMNKYKNLRRDGFSVEESITTTVEDTGFGLTGAAIATMLAFLAFLAGSMPEMNRFGLLMTIGVGAAFFLSIIGLPSLLILEEKLFHLISKKMHFGVDNEYVLYEKNAVHPDTHEIVNEIDHNELLYLKKQYKIVRKKSSLPPLSSNEPTKPAHSLSVKKK